MGLGKHDNLNLQVMKVKKVAVVNAKKAEHNIKEHSAKELQYLGEFGAKESFIDYAHVTAGMKKHKSKLPSPKRRAARMPNPKSMVRREGHANFRARNYSR